MGLAIRRGGRRGGRESSGLERAWLWAAEAAARSGRPGRIAAEIADGRLTSLGLARSHGRVERQAAEACAQRRAAFYRSMWLDAAAAVGADAVALDDGVIELRLGGLCLRAKGSDTDLDSAARLALAADKPATHEILVQAGLCVPRYAVVGRADFAEAVRQVERLRPAVVKPAADTAMGQGVVGNVFTAAQARHALISAGRRSARVLVEEQVPGRVFRVLVLDGEVLGTVERRPLVLQGDGLSSVGRMITLENQRRVADPAELGGPVTATLDVVNGLAAAGESLHSVPALGRPVALGVVVNANRAADDVHVADPPAPLTDAARAAAGAIGLRLTGVDLIMGADGEVTVLEVNGTPGLRLHASAPDFAQVAARVAAAGLTSRAANH